MMALSLSRKNKFGGSSEEKSPNQYNNVQSSSMLLQLPRELRDQIYTCLFTSTEINFGKEDYVANMLFKTEIRKQGPHALAILRTCRRIYSEAKPLWLGQVLFCFQRPIGMLDKLSVLPFDVLSQIRYVRTGGTPMLLQPIGDTKNMYYRLAWVLKLLPGLQLERLTVLGSSLGDLVYDALSGLVKHSAGWRELHFLTPNSMMLSFNMPAVFSLDAQRRKPQPGNWNEALLQRDGPDSGASVIIYRSTEPGVPTGPCTRKIFEQKVPSLDALKEFGITADEELEQEDERQKGFLVVVKRGRNVDIVEQGGPPCETEFYIRKWAHDMTWPEIRLRCIVVFE